MSTVINTLGTPVDNETAGEFIHQHIDGGRQDSVACVLLEQGLFECAKQLSPTDYQGGLWTFYRLDNGGFYVAPDSISVWDSEGSSYRVQCEGNFYEGTMSPDAFGIVVTLFTLNHLMWFIFEKTQEGDGLLMIPDPKAVGERLHRLYYLLREAADDHPEAVAIFSAID